MEGDSSRHRTLAVEDLDGDSLADLVVEAGTGAGSRVTAYHGSALTVGGVPAEAFGFDAFPGFGGGVFVGKPGCGVADGRSPSAGVLTENRRHAPRPGAKTYRLGCGRRVQHDPVLAAGRRPPS